MISRDKGASQVKHVGLPPDPPLYVDLEINKALHEGLTQPGGFDYAGGMRGISPKFSTVAEADAWGLGFAAGRASPT